MSCSLLFLDFDGVLHPFGCWVDQHFSRLPVLEAWLRWRPGVDIVVTSTWRQQHTLEELRARFAADLQSRVIGATPVFKRDDWAQRGEVETCHYERHAEVLRWLAQSGEPARRWAALDDQPELYKPRCVQLVLCNGKVGLMQRELDRVDAILGSSCAGNQSEHE